MSVKVQTLPAESDKPCNGCGRTHRKLYLYHGYWLGKTCLEQYDYYLFNRTSPTRTRDAWFMEIAGKFEKMTSGR